MKTKAFAIRVKMEEQARNVPWHAGVSYGSVYGELRGVMDMDGERQFFVLPPSGANRIQCVFPEDMRTLMQQSLFKPVKVYGYLHYDGLSPFPHLMEAQKIEGIEHDDKITHFADLSGLFRGLDPPDDGIAALEMP